MGSANISEQKQAFMAEVSGTRKKVLDAAAKWRPENDVVYTDAVKTGYLAMRRT